MRDAFHEDLNWISEQLVEMTRLAGSAMSRATTALLDADIALAEGVIAADQRLDDIRVQIDDRAIDLLARQQPVATDLRMIVTAMQMGADLERMGDLAKHIAKVARLRFPNSAVPAEIRPIIIEMDTVAKLIVTQTGAIISRKDAQGATQLVQADDRMDALHKQVFTLLLDERRQYGIEEAIDITLLARYYERFADHAVLVAHRVAYLVTGEWQTVEGRQPTDNDPQSTH
ncbi:phosphate uptake regulator, PhoU [Austwickia chelonae]|uniref:Phosphate-specific transport system accessory protein PhoU n=1 Tax=Austwickia chelonae NBRC 105200 TaxID=1184607 RepID=K6UM58_9MICO|nr:phosphate signaling complex protein PhoU [Austwickia chelonae]GAB77826.1 phosphate transport system regulatory protein [Austwickia chelonae NBRC 105200]SEV90284.1 phosphate uptake regulator, PhoU [Austwickia chelonae]